MFNAIGAIIDEQLPSEIVGHLFLERLPHRHYLDCLWRVICAVCPLSYLSFCCNGCDFVRCKVWVDPCGQGSVSYWLTFYSFYSF